MSLKKFEAPNSAWRIPLGCSLDDILSGGLESRVITQVYGPAGVGKTNFCLQATVNCVRDGKKVIYVDTEGGRSVERIRQIAGDDFDKVLENTYFYEPTTFDDQDTIVENLDKVMNKGFGLIILDSVVALYRLVGPSENGDATKHEKLYKQMLTLRRLAKDHNAAVVVTAQVYMASDNGEVKSFGWSRLDYSSKVILELIKTGSSKREAILRRHLSLPEDISTRFVIAQEGLKDA